MVSTAGEVLESRKQRSPRPRRGLVAAVLGVIVLLSVVLTVVAAPEKGSVSGGSASSLPSETASAGASGAPAGYSFGAPQPYLGIEASSLPEMFAGDVTVFDVSRAGYGIGRITTLPVSAGYAMPSQAGALDALLRRVARADGGLTDVGQLDMTWVGDVRVAKFYPFGDLAYFMWADDHAVYIFTGARGTGDVFLAAYLTGVSPLSPPLN